MARKSKYKALSDVQYIYGAIFLVANKLQTLMDRDLSPHGITSCQWFLTCVVEYLFDSAPTLGEAAEAMGSSRQNVKQVALKLQKKGFLRMEKDENDARTLRLSVTGKSREFWSKRQEQADGFIGEFFSGFRRADLAGLRKALTKLEGNLDRMDKKYNEMN